MRANRNRCRLAKLAGFSLLPVMVGGSALGATIPYSQNFNLATGDTLPAEFIEGGSEPTTTANNNSSATITAGGGYRQVITGATTVFGGLPITNAAGNSFTASVQFTYEDIVAGGANTTALTTNLVFLGSSSDLSAGNNYRLGYNPSTTLASGGRLTLAEIGTIADLTVSPSLGGGTQAAVGGNITSGGLTIAGQEGTPVYTMSLTATYTGSTINLAGSLTDGTTTITLGATDASARNGNNFGLRIASNNAANTQITVFDNFTVAVPEPSSAALAGIVAIGLLRRRRR